MNKHKLLRRSKTRVAKKKICIQPPFRPLHVPTGLVVQLQYKLPHKYRSVPSPGF